MRRSPPPRVTVDRLPPEWPQMPERLILNLEEPIREFMAALERTHQYDYSVGDFIDEILIYVRASFIDLEALEEFIEETQHHFPEDAPVLVPAVARLGKSLLRELHLCGAYTSDGLLHYVLERWINPYTPVLVRAAILKK